MSHIVPDFTIFVYDSSFNSLFFGLILSSFLSLCIPWHSVQHWGVPVSRKRKKRSKNDTEKRELHELPYTEIVNSRTIRLTSGPPLPLLDFSLSNWTGKLAE